MGAGQMNPTTHIGRWVWEVCMRGSNEGRGAVQLRRARAKRHPLSKIRPACSPVARPRWQGCHRLRRPNEPAPLQSLCVERQPEAVVPEDRDQGGPWHRETRKDPRRMDCGVSIKECVPLVGSGTWLRTICQAGPAPLLERGSSSLSNSARIRAAATAAGLRVFLGRSPYAAPAITMT
jgi:hypothetical protein